MPSKYIEYANREEWLAGRKDHIGASEMGVICEVSSFKSQQELWKEKTGRKNPDDISENPLVAYGTKAEEHLRALFSLKHPEYEVEYHAYRVYQHDEYDWLTCTLDGEIVETETGRRGILEIKTKLIFSAADREEWNGKIPSGYYCQVCEQLFVTGYDFAILVAELRRSDGSAEILEYMIERADSQADIEWVIRKAVDFHKYIEEDKEPPMKLSL